MGFFDDLMTWFGFKKKQAKVLCVGLDNSGKTTIINQLKPDTSKCQNITPTIGFSVDIFTHANLSFTVFDMSGQGRYRGLWEHYYKDVHAVMFVVDSSDKLRLPVAKDELDQLLAHPDVAGRHLPILLLANKSDLRESLSHIQCSKHLELDKLRDTAYHICSTNALTGDGLEDAVSWLSEQVRSWQTKQS
ncbi:ADP-ribosylation factor-like protein 6 [Halichondria panicea]|uniref:ADP-ribosylation factor-like protein 6 n=1 Tax=Halichondria panicea TaxID=6063 RepID=UPI00312B328D